MGDHPIDSSYQPGSLVDPNDATAAAERAGRSEGEQTDGTSSDDTLAYVNRLISQMNQQDAPCEVYETLFADDLPSKDEGTSPDPAPVAQTPETAPRPQMEVPPMPSESGPVRSQRTAADVAPENTQPVPAPEEETAITGLSTAWLADRISGQSSESEKKDKPSAAAEAVVPPEPKRPAKVRRQATRPGDVHADLERLREAANLTAFGALHTFDCRSLVRRSYIYLAFSVASVFLSTALVELTTAVNSMAYFLSVATMLLAVWSTWRYFSSTLVLCAKLKARQPSERADRIVQASPTRPPLSKTPS